MTREKAIEQLKALQRVGDAEGDHRMADEILCELLNVLGYGDVVAEWEKIDKWYA